MDSQANPKKRKMDGKGRTPKYPENMGKYIGMDKARDELQKALLEEQEQEAREEANRIAAKSAATARARKARAEKRRFLGSGSDSEIDQPVDKCPVDGLASRVKESLASIQEVATKSKNLKGNFVGALKTAVCSIDEAVKIMAKRNRAEDGRLLHRLNGNLKHEVSVLREELKHLREEMREVRMSAMSKPSLVVDDGGGRTHASPSFSTSRRPIEGCWRCRALPGAGPLHD